MFRLRRRPTATRMASSDRRRPQAVIGSAYSQSLLCGALEANSLALSISELAPSQIAFTSRVTFGSSHDRWRRASVSLGQERAFKELQVSRADATTVSTPTLHATSIRSCRSRVFAAEAKKAESASEDTRRIPRPPSRIGRLAWSQ